MSALLGGCAVSSDPAPRLASAIQSGVEPGLDVGVGSVYPAGTKQAVRVAWHLQGSGVTREQNYVKNEHEAIGT